MVKLRRIRKDDLADVIRLCEAEHWLSYVRDPEQTWRVLSAPGVTSVVALDSGRVIGLIQMQSDGAIQAHISLLLVAADRRGRGVGTQLVRHAFELSGAQRVDVTTEDARSFYRSFAHKERTGFQIHPQVEKGEAPGGN